MSLRGSDPWRFDYAPIRVAGGDDGSPDDDIVVATTDDVDPAVVVETLAPELESVEVTPLFSGHPIFWTRIQASSPIDRDELVGKLAKMGVRVRYAASAKRGNQRLPPPLDFSLARQRRSESWTKRNASAGAEPESPWRWFLGRDGVDVSRVLCGSGAGTRLALIDNDGGGLDSADLDAEVAIGVGTIPRASAHAGLLAGWAVGSRANGFRGVAPDASTRLYCIPKACTEILWLPLAIVRAVEDGADVVFCATAIEGFAGMLLDDALEFATRLGRAGKGTPVVLPTGREMSSSLDSVRSSLSLGLSDPASDPRAFCVGPSARDGGWFLWRDRHGKLRPFANRGPTVRWLAPGDDMASPLAKDDRPAHAESSGASAVASGVLLLLIGRNPELTLHEIDRLLVGNVTGVDPAQRCAETNLGDPMDLLPVASDADGHNAKHGYGRLSASAACVAASDPIAATLLGIGEVAAAQRYLSADAPNRAYSEKLGRWAARVLLADACLEQALRGTARAARLLLQDPARERRHPPGYLLHHIGLAVRLLMRAEATLEIQKELELLDHRIRDCLANQAVASAADEAILRVLERAMNERGDDKTTPDTRTQKPAERDRVRLGAFVERESSPR